jgi:riboflavin transporter FmnP
MAYVLIIALIAGLLMYLLCANSKAQRIGEMMLFSAILALLIALAPATVHMLHG